MKMYFAPMEGITGCLYRCVHAEVFGGADRYYAPFIYANPDGHIGGRDLYDLLPENNQGIRLIPQVLSNHAQSFLATAETLKEMGYSEVNLNLGCPSKKVSGKGRGAGFLADPERLQAFLDEVFEKTPLPVSIKTRVGISDEAEFDRLLDIYERFPVREMIIHPRLRDDYYRGPLHPHLWKRAAERLKCPLVYNGDLFRVSDIRMLAGQDDAPEALMIGRGALANPALMRQAGGGKRAEADELQRMHRLLYEGYSRRIASKRKVLSLMKEQWQFWRYLMASEVQEQVQAILRTADDEVYRDLTKTLFEHCLLLEDSIYGE